MRRGRGGIGGVEGVERGYWYWLVERRRVGREGFWVVGEKFIFVIRVGFVSGCVGCIVGLEVLIRTV